MLAFSPTSLSCLNYHNKLLNYPQLTLPAKKADAIINVITPKAQFEEFFGARPQRYALVQQRISI